mgnify:CR=1 FL=1
MGGIGEACTWVWNWIAPRTGELTPLLVLAANFLQLKYNIHGSNNERRMWPALALLSLVFLATGPGPPGLCAVASELHSHTIVKNRTCAKRGDGAYCSLGKVRGYVGLLDTAAQLKEALEATAFKKEIIVFAETRMTDTAQMLARMRGQAGYGHVMALMNEVRDCQRLARVMISAHHEQGPVSCGAYTSKDAR